MPEAVGGAWRRWGMGVAAWLAALAAQAAHVVEPVPAWVEWSAPVAPPAEKSGDERVALLTDEQALLDGANTTWFHRRVSQVLASSGSKDASEISVDFYPSYESVVLHGAWVERAGKREDRLPGARIDELRREDGLEQGVIDGKHTLHLVIDDVRAGDVVDFALSVRGANPALAAQQYGYWSLQAGIPTRERRLRVLRREPGALPFRAIGELEPPRRGTHAGYAFHEWRVRDARPRRGEDDVAPWFDEGPSVEFGGAPDWAAVAAWAGPLYDDALADPAIAALAQELGLKRGDASEANVLRAIAFVQDEIRYTGLELGAHAYQPYPPAEVIRRRYGDCKDKATLLAGLLRHLGLEAQPALVDVDEREHVVERLPSANAFDHVIVHFVRDGRSYWVDATAQMQRGDLAHFVQADFGRALVIGPGETGLRRIAAPAPGAPQVDIEEVFQLRDGQGGLAEDADYAIRTVYRGAQADAARRRFASESAQAIGEGYAEAIGENYPGLQLVAAPTMQDDPVRNEVTVQETYRIEGVWRPREGDGETGTETAFWLSEVDGWLPAPGKPARRSPREWRGPFEVRQKLTVELDGGWPEADRRVTVDNPHFKFERHARNDGERLVLDGRLVLASREVPAVDARKLAADIDKAESWMGYELTLGADDALASDDDAEALAALGTQWLDWRLLPLLLGVLATWGWVVYCGLRPADNVWRGMYFRPRESARAAVAGDRTTEAGLLLVLATTGSLLMEPSTFGKIDNHALLLLALLAAGALAGLFAIIFYFVYAGLILGCCRLLGGRAGYTPTWMSLGWSQVPVVASLPVMALLVLLYGGGGEEDAAAATGTLLAIVTLVLPLTFWGLLSWFAALAEINGFSLRRAVAAGFLLPLVVLIALVVAVVAVSR